MEPEKIYVNFEQDYFVPAIGEQLPCQVLYVNFDSAMEKIYKWLDEETLATDYVSKKAFEEAMRKVFKV